MSSESRLDINVLGTSFAIKANEDSAYLKRIHDYLRQKTEDTKEKTLVKDPLKISILTSFYIVDELFKAGGEVSSREQDSSEIEEIFLSIIDRIDQAVDGVES